jgi:DNA replication licensing factor MCM4
MDDLSAYIAYARSRINPTITAEAGDELVRCYVTLRKAGEPAPTASKVSKDSGGSERRITATTRQLESMIRLAEAHARMRFSGTVDVRDVREAFRLMREAINTSARDPLTGEVDMGALEGAGGSRQQRRLRGDLRREVLALLDGAGPAAARGVRWADALRKMEEQSSVKVTPAEFGETVRELQMEGLVKIVGERDKRVIRRAE